MLNVGLWTGWGRHLASFLNKTSAGVDTMEELFSDEGGRETPPKPSVDQKPPWRRRRIDTKGMWQSFFYFYVFFLTVDRNSLSNVFFCLKSNKVCKKIFSPNSSSRCCIVGGGGFIGNESVPAET